jgi:eukaryotic-like serine/threonine-protein kinase
MSDSMSRYRRAVRAADDGAGGGSGSNVALGDHILIDLAKPLTAFNRPGAEAFSAIDKRFADAEHVAYVCEPDRSVRIRTAQRLRGFNRSGLLNLLDSGVLRRPSGRDAYGFVFEKPVGLTPARRAWGGWTPKVLINNFLKPACAALAELAERDAIHGSIRPNNVFHQDTKGQMFALGPCVLGPPGFDQPAAFETIERALATPDGKGAGGSIDDMFGLGMTLYCFATGKYPGEGQDPDALMARRLAYGSISAMVDTSQVPSELLDAVVSLLDDDIKERWSLAALTDWCNGRRPELSNRRPAARRGTTIQIGPVACLEPRELSYAITRYPGPAAAALHRGDIAVWLKANDVQRVLALAIDETGKKEAQELLASDAVQLGREAVRCDPMGPVRYRDLSFFPNGAGAVMYAALLDPGKRDQMQELFGARLVHLWAKAATPLGLVDEQAKMLLDVEDRISHGLEKIESALYILNPDAPCLSPAVSGTWVDAVGDLLPVIEHQLQNGSFDPDPHIVAFLSARGGIKPADLMALKTFDGKDPRAAATVLKLGVKLQIEAAGRQLPNLCRLCLKAAQALIGRLRQPHVREEQMQKADAAASANDIQTLADLATDPVVFGGDGAEFMRAKHEWDANQRILDMRESIEDANRRMARDKGQEIALLILSAAAVITVLVQLFFQLVRSG